VVGYFMTQSRAAQATQIDAFLQGLKELGYTDGQNITIEYRFTDGFPERSAPLAKELVALMPDVIVSGAAFVAGTTTLFVAQATSTIPIVVATFGAAPSTSVNVARPEANVTGIISSEVLGDRQRFELAKEMIPGATRIGYLLGTGGADAGAATRQAAEAAAVPVGVKLVFGESKSADDVEAAFQTLVAQRVDAVFSGGGQFSVARAKIIAASRAARMPTIYAGREAVAEGGLVSYGADPRVGNRRAAYFVDKILKGAKPADLPAEKLNTSLLAVNLTAAKAMGFTFPASVLARATETIQ
jgi:putative ABC transport system substrate-binding protein